MVVMMQVRIQGKLSDASGRIYFAAWPPIKGSSQLIRGPPPDGEICRVPSAEVEQVVAARDLGALGVASSSESTGT